MLSPFRMLRIGASPTTHAFALLCATLLVFGLKVQNFDLQRMVGPVDNRYFETYTPYYPGLANLNTHELFNSAYRDKKKIVILGASAADSIGCDASWSTPDKTRVPDINAHYTCSITGQLNELLKARGYDDWRAFDLARNGASLTPMLYTYARAMEVKPEVVIFGESFPYYMHDDANSDALSADMYRHLDALFDRPSTKSLWLSYRKTIAEKSVNSKWSLPPYSPALLPPAVKAEPRDRTSALDLGSRVFSEARESARWDLPPLPAQFYPDHRVFQPLSTTTTPYPDPDPGLDFFQGFGLMGELQREHGEKMLVYFLPMYDRRKNVEYNKILTSGPYANFLDQHGIDHTSLVQLPLKPVEDTYDGVHQTRYGNRIIATAILNDLIARRIVTRK